MTPCPSETPQDLQLEHDQPERAGQRGEGHAGRRYQHVFRRANILPYFSHVQCLYLISKTINKSFCAKLVLLQLNARSKTAIMPGAGWCGDPHRRPGADQPDHHHRLGRHPSLLPAPGAVTWH